MRPTKAILSHFLVGFTVLRRRKESKEEQEEKEEGGGEEEDQGMESCILGFRYEFPWRIDAPWSRVLEEIT